MCKRIREDIAAVRQRDPAARSGFEILLMYAGVHALFWHRPAHWLYRHHCFFLARLVSQLTRFFTGIEIHPGAVIGHNVFIDHGSGIVIGETAEVGDGCTLYQGVTLGGTGKDTGKRHPTIGNHVVVAAGAKVLGPFKVGDYSKIGAGAVVLKEVPPYCTVVGVPGRIVRRRCPEGEEIGPGCVQNAACPYGVDQGALDQIHLPDPVENELQALRSRVAALEQQIAQMTIQGGIRQ